MAARYTGKMVGPIGVGFHQTAWECRVGATGSHIGSKDEKTRMVFVFLSVLGFYVWKLCLLGIAVCVCVCAYPLAEGREWIDVCLIL